MRERDVIAKIKEDLAGAVGHWQGRMTSWCFVHNNNQGLTAKAVQVLDDLRAAYPTIEISVWAWPEIREQFNRLSDDALVELFGSPPTARSFGQLDFAQLRPVVEQVAKEEPDPLVPLGNPPSSAKLEKNSLDADSAEFLKLGRGRVRLVEEYFAEHHDPSVGDQIARAMQA